MTNYHTWSSGTGTFTSPGNAFDGSYGDTSTYATATTTNGTGKSQLWQNTTSLTGMTAITFKTNPYYTIGSGIDTDGSVNFEYSWDGTNWYNIYIDNVSKTNTTEITAAVSNFTTSTNLNTLRIRASVWPGSFYDDSIPRQFWYASTLRVYDLSVEVSAGPVITVSAITKSGTEQQGNTIALSCTATNETSGVTWGQVSGPVTSSYSGHSFNSGTGYASVNWLAPSGVAASGTYVLRCTSNTDNTKYSNVTITIPTVSVALNSNNYGYTNILARNANRTFTVLVTGHTSGCSWTCSGGSIGSSTGVYTAPSTPGVYTITATHTVDTSKTTSSQVFVDYGIPASASSAVTGNADDACYDLTSAYDLNTGTAAGITCSAWTSYQGSAKNSGVATATYASFPSYAYNTAVLYFRSYGAGRFLVPTLYYKIGTGAAQFVGNFPWSAVSTQSVGLPNNGNLNNVSVLIEAYGTASFDYDFGQSQWIFQSASNDFGYLYELWVEPSSAYTAALDHIAPGTGAGKKIYPSNLYSTVNGVLSTPTTSVTANYVIDGSNGYWFITNA